MNNNVYVSFNDSIHDPTYTSAEGVLLVESASTEQNPCASGHTYREVSVMPRTLEEVRVFADIMGWSVETDHEGQVVLYTGILK
jgi:hypothetical protein